MKKTTKGAIAVGAATLLLLGGGGTLALWNDQATIAAGTLTTGELKLVDDGEGAWYLYEDGLAIADYPTAGTEIDTATYLVVPEDELIYIRSGVQLEALGTELYFAFGADLGAADANGFTISTVQVTDPSNALGTSPSGTFEPAPTAGQQVYGGADVDIDATLALSFVVEFDADGLDHQAAQIDFDSAAITVNQVIKQ